MVSFNALPDELLLWVLDLAIEQVTVPPLFVDGSNVWALTHVSSHFRSLTIHTPRFWEKVTSTVTRRTDTNGVDHPIQAVLERARTRPIHLHLVWPLDRPLPTDSSPPALELPRIISIHCAPFSRRIIRLSMAFHHLTDYDDFATYSRLPNDFFDGLSELHIEFTGNSWPSTLRINPIFDERLFHGVVSPKVVIQTPTQPLQAIDESARLPSLQGHAPDSEPRMSNTGPRSILEPIRLSLSPGSSKISRLSLNGLGLIHTPLEVAILLRNLPQLEHLEGWVSNARNRHNTRHKRSTYSRRLELPDMKSLNLTICEESAKVVETLTETLSILVMPSLLQLAVYHYLDGVVKGVSLWDDIVEKCAADNYSFSRSAPKFELLKQDIRIREITTSSHCDFVL